MKEAVIVSGVRTPVGKYMGALREVHAYDLAALVLNEALRRANEIMNNPSAVFDGDGRQLG